MKDSLRQETERLARSWMEHAPGWLRDYLVAGVEDPRVNLQSILSRHFLTRELFGERFASLMAEEYRFSAAMNWLRSVAEKPGGREEFEPVLFGLRRGADNAEGIDIPTWLLPIFASLPGNRNGIQVPNYIEQFLSSQLDASEDVRAREIALNTFRDCWRSVLAEAKPAPTFVPAVVEPACGSANDFRFLHQYGLAQFTDYTGFDLCATNIENARSLFPAARFEPGNVFAISSDSKAFDYCLVHDLFEHLSLEGLTAAIQEVCRVTRLGICAGFFQMEEIPEHVVRPVDEYHWNLLSMSRTRELFAESGFEAQVLHIATFLRETTGCDRFHNPNAYTLLMRAASLAHRVDET